jgi:hypothetical protein
MSGLPSAHSDPWTAAGTAGAGTVSDGVLTIATTGIQTLTYSKTSAALAGLNLADGTFETKCRISGAYGNDQSLAFVIRDDSLNRSLSLTITPGAATLSENSTGTPYIVAQLDVKEWHIYRVTASGSPNPTLTLYIDGINMGSFINTVADAAANDTILFGDTNATSGANVLTEIEWVAYADTATVPLAANSATGNLDDITCVNEILDSTTAASLKTTKASSVFGTDKINGITLPNPSVPTSVRTSMTTATFTELPELRYYFPSDGKTAISLSALTNLQWSAGGVSTLGLVMSIDDDLASALSTSLFNDGRTVTGDSATINFQTMALNIKLVYTLVKGPLLQ